LIPPEELFPIFFSGRPLTVDQVRESHQRVPVNHARAAVSHDLPYFLAHRRLVAVSGAFRAGRLGGFERAFHEAFQRVFFELSAFFAKAVRVMNTLAVKGYHRGHGLFFALNPFISHPGVYYAAINSNSPADSP
jgi:hypothetical protein